MLRRALQAIADGRANVDAWIAQIPPRDRASPGIGAAIGRRLLAAGWTKEALTVLEDAKPKRRAARVHDRDDPFDIMDGGGDSDWEEVHIEALDAAGQIGLAQQLRWAGFEQRLSATRLRAYLKRLPDFEDFEAERRALRHALGYRSFATALHFLHEWPDPAGAAQLVLARHAEIDGNLKAQPVAKWPFCTASRSLGLLRLPRARPGDPHCFPLALPRLDRAPSSD